MADLRQTYELERMDGRITNPADGLSGTATITADDILDNGADAHDEVDIARLDADDVATLEEHVNDLSDPSIGILDELVSRGRFYGLFSRSADNAWYDLGMALRKEQAERYDRHTSLIPSYTTVDGVPSSVGNVTSRLLNGWVIEAQIMPASDANSRNPSYKTIVAEVDSETHITADTQGWVGRLSSERGFRLSGLNDNEGTTFGIAPLTPGEDTTIWPRDDFADDWNDPWYPVTMTTYPNKTAYNNSKN